MAGHGGSNRWKKRWNGRLRPVACVSTTAFLAHHAPAMGRHLWGFLMPLRLLGPMAVVADGKVLPLPASRKTRALLGYLAAEARPVRRDRLCHLFWEVPDDPKGALRWSLSKLRGVLGEAIVADRETAALNLG